MFEELLRDLEKDSIDFSLTTMSSDADDCGVLNIHAASKIYGKKLNVRVNSVGKPGYLQCDFVLENVHRQAPVLTVLLGHDLKGSEPSSPLHKPGSSFNMPNWGFFSDFGRMYPDIEVEPLMGIGDEAGWVSPTIHNTSLFKVIEEGTEAAIFGVNYISRNEREPASLPLLAILLAQFVHDVTTD